MWTSKWMTTRRRVLPIGVDIGHSGVKMVQLARSDGHTLVVASDRAPLTLNCALDAPETRAAVVPVIREMLSRGNFKGRDAVSALSSDELRITSLRLADTEMHQTTKAVRREAAQRFGMDPHKDTINYLLAGSVRQGDDLKNEFIVLAVDNDTVRSHIGLLEEAGLQPVGIDAAPCALFRNFERSLRREEDRQRTALFVDVGHRCTTVLFGRDGEMCFVKQIPVGAARFNEKVASQLDLGLEEAEALRLRLHTDESIDPGTRRLTTDALTSAAEELARELSLCLRYYTVTFRGKRVERAVIAGGGAREIVLLDVLRRHLSVEIDVAEPLRGLELSEGSDSLTDGSAHADFALAIGLSLKGDPRPRLGAYRVQKQEQTVSALESEPS
jgi:type IV pilus assembly protein PilM